jgi:hypothetical protein
MLQPGTEIMLHHQIVLATLIGALAIGVNLPLGYAREGAPRFSGRWFLYIHLSIPLIALLRTSNRLDPWAIPVFVACAVLGQVAGGMLRRRRNSA